MPDMNIYPFTRKIVLEQKSEAEQNALLSDVNKNVNPLITPADYTPVYVTDQPIVGVTDEISNMKPSISVVEQLSEPTQVEKTVKQEVKTSGKPQPLIGTIIVTALIVTAGFFLYKRLTKSK